MAKIKFNIKYRPEIESGKYKVVTSTNKPVRIICWDKVAKEGQDKDLRLCVLISGDDGESCYYYHLSGKPWLSNESDGDLFIMTDEPELTEFEMQYATYLYGSQAVEMFGQEQIEAVKKEWAAILAIVRKEMRGEIPHWHHMKSGAAGSGDGRNIYLIRDGLDSYRFSPVIAGGDDFLVLAELDKLPKLC